MTMSIGVVGVGKMGSCMALNLLKKYIVYVYDTNKKVQADLVKQGAIGCSNLTELCANASYIITMLQTSRQVAMVYTSKAGILNNCSDHTILIDCSSIDIKTSIKLHNIAVQKNISMIDAPVSGGVIGAQEGTLTFMVGGKEEDYNKALPILLSMGKKAIYAGKAGNGQASKICNNMLLGITMIGVCEAFLLAEKLGVDPVIFFNICQHSSSKCWVITDYLPIKNVISNVPANDHFKPGFTTQLMLKDLLLSQDAARITKINTIMGKTATKLYKKFVSLGNKNLDFSGIITMLQ